MVNVRFQNKLSFFLSLSQRKAKGKDLINSICAGLNILEKDYFGLLYSTVVDPRVWLDLDKPVTKFFKSDPWVLQFAVKFYPPEPSQLQEDITRYHLCLQVSKKKFYTVIYIHLRTYLDS